MGTRNKEENRVVLAALEAELEEARENFSTAYNEYVPLKQQDTLLKNYVIPTENETLIATINSKNIASGDRAWEEATKLKNLVASKPEYEQLRDSFEIEKEELDLIRKYADSYQKDFFKSQDIINLVGNYEPTAGTSSPNQDDLTLYDGCKVSYEEPFDTDTTDFIYNLCTFAEEWKKTVFYTHNALFYDLVVPSTTCRKCDEKLIPWVIDDKNSISRELAITDYDTLALIDNGQPYEKTKNEPHNPDRIYPCYGKRVAGFCVSKNYYTTQKIYAIKRKGGKARSIDAFTKATLRRGALTEAPERFLTFLGFCRGQEDYGEVTILSFIDPTGEYDIKVPRINAHVPKGHVCAFTVEFAKGSTTFTPYSMFIYPINFIEIYGDINTDTDVVYF